MRTLAENWATARSGLYRYEVKVTIAGVEYGESSILSVSTSASLFADKPAAVGVCAAKEIDLDVLPLGDIPRMAEIRAWVRPVADGVEAEWLPKGVFYSDTRKVDSVTGLVSIHGYDAMLKLEQVYIEDGKDITGWPKSMDVVAADIAALVGVEIDERTTLNAGYMVEAPVGYTMREVMGWIAAAHGGNWTITDAGKLRLVPLANIPGETYYLIEEHGDYLLFGEDRIWVGPPEQMGTVSEDGGKKVMVGNAAVSLETSPAFAPFTGVTVWYDDELAYQSGDDSGRRLELDCPWATQAMADNILESINGYSYQPFVAQTALLDPAAELGDAVIVGGFYSLLASIDTTFDAMMTSDISAPADEEVDHEYPYESRTSREMKRKVTLGKDYFGAKITKANGLEITKSDVDGNQKSRVVLNSDKLAFFTDAGSEALYFDPNTGRYKFVGDIVVDGNINMSGGSITWGKNNPAAGIDPGLDDDEVVTLITEELVSGPNIMGANYWSSDKNTWMNLLDASETTVGIGGGLEVEAGGVHIFSAIRDAILSVVLSSYGTEFLQITSTGTIMPKGKWDFQIADVTGLTPTWG